MNHSESIERFKHDTEEVPAGARDRVWRKLGEPQRAPDRRWLVRGLVFAACMAAGFVVMGKLSGPAATSVFNFDRAVAVTTGEATRSADGTLHLARGQALISSWGAPGITLTAGAARVEAEAAVFWVDVAGQQVTVDVREGQLQVNGERVEAGARWPSGRLTEHPYAGLQTREPASAGEDRSWSLAERALAAGQYPEALKRFDALGGQGLRAEAALLKKGELQLRQLGSPAQALVTFGEAQRRFPTGSLGQEVALSSLEATLTLEQWHDARARATDFLARFPGSEREADVRYVGAIAAWRLDDKKAACGEIKSLQPAAFSEERRASLEKLASQCTFIER